MSKKYDFLRIFELLHTFFSNIDILYDYTADLTGIGDRSVHVKKDE